jgi:hypothetical protein
MCLGADRREPARPPCFRPFSGPAQLASAGHGFTFLKSRDSSLSGLSLIESITARGSARQTRDENGKFSQADVVAQRGLPVSARRFT